MQIKFSTSLKILLTSGLLLSSLAFQGPAQAQVEIIDTPEGSQSEDAEVGEKAARKYFQEREPTRSARRSLTSVGERYMALHIGTYFEQEVYNWGRSQKEDIGDLNVGVSYRIGEWVNSMDLLFRADVSSYSLEEGRATKLSLLPLVTFPDAKSEFPIYFGAGLGLGIFFKQIGEESTVSVDWQLVAGARLFEVFDSVGLIFETGLKNHFLLFSDGQYNGVFFTAGTVFNF